MNKSKGAPKPQTRERRCVGCREMRGKSELLRIVRSPEGSYAIDLIGKAPGRGAYICRAEDCFAKAFKQKGFERSFKTKISPEIYEHIKEILNNE